MEGIITDTHKELINKKIEKAIKSITDEELKEIVIDYITKEFDVLWDECKVKDTLQQLVTDVIKSHLVKSGLIKKEDIT